VLSPRERAQEALFTGLRRREGVDLGAFRVAHGVDVLSEYAAGLHAPFAARLIERRGPFLRLTEEGVLLSNEVFQVLV
jgi:oxygen-independent coproporphyrinogen-3 oxidase